MGRVCRTRVNTNADALYPVLTEHGFRCVSVSRGENAMLTPTSLDYGEEIGDGEIVPETTPVPMVAPVEMPTEAPVAPERETIEV
jgi:hypothetical protein